jgi:transcriptional regulator with XRE-family HTH domain
MKPQPNEAIRQLRRVIGRTQAEFAAMIGASKDAVASWEIGRNKVSAAFARRICLATGVDGKLLLMGINVPLANDPSRPAQVYTAEDFERYRRTQWGRSGEEGAQHHLKQCVDALELLFMAAAKPGGGKVRHRLPGVVDSFIQWCEQASEEFKLGPQIKEQLKKRKFQCGVTQTYREWRAMHKIDPAALSAAGFRDNKGKRDGEELRLELEAVPGWAPGRSMNKPKPAIIEVLKSAEPEEKRERKPRTWR